MARPFTFIHAADLHLDAPFRGVDATDPRVRDSLVESTYTALDRIVSIAEERDVDFVVVAGDAYNSRDKSLRAQMRFQAACRRLEAAGVSVLLVQGNHDPADGWSARLETPANVIVFPTDAVGRFPVTDPGTGAQLCAVYGRGYATGATRTNLARGFERDPADETAIAVLHANVGGQEGYEPYAPCTLDDLRNSGFDYWALGHIHKPADLAEDPRIRYAGSPQGLNPKEDGPHGVWLVTMERGRVLAEEFVETSAVRWSAASLDAAPIDSLEDVRAAVRTACDDVRGAADGRPVIVRLELLGRTSVHGVLSRGTAAAELLEELREEQMAEYPWVWIDRLRDSTEGPLDVEFLRGVEDFSGDLVRITDALLADPEQAQALLAEALAGVDGAFGARERDAAGVLERARDLALDRLLGGEDR